MSLSSGSAACSARLNAPSAVVATAKACVGGTLKNDADAALYASCDSVSGDLHIQGSSLTSLAALTRLRAVSGTLDISDNPELDDLQGLTQLSLVGALRVHANAELDDLRGLEHLRSAAFISVTDNPELASLAGLEGIERAQSLRIERNGIYETTGLEHLIEVGMLSVNGNSKLISLRGLKGLKRAESVEISKNPMLAAYYGLLPELQSVEQPLILNHNAGLSKREVRGLFERVGSGTGQPSVTTGEARLEASLR